MSSYSDYLQIVSPIIRGQGQAKADAQREKGRIWGGTLAGLGELVANVPIQMSAAKQREAENRRADEQGQLNRRRLDQDDQRQQFESQANEIVTNAMVDQPDGTKTFDRGRLQAGFSAAKIPLEMQQSFLSSLDALDESARKRAQSRRDDIADIADFALASGGEPNDVIAALSYGRANNLLTPQDEGAFLELLNGAEHDINIPKGLTLLRSRGSKYQGATPTITKGTWLDTIKDGTPGKVFQPDVPGSFVESPPKASTTAAPNVGSFEDFVIRKYGETPTAAQVMDARTAWERANNAPTAGAKAPDVGTFEDFVQRKYGPRPSAEQVIDARAAWAKANDTTAAATGSEPPSQYVVERSQRTIEAVDALLSKTSGWTTGGGSLLGNLPATDARNFRAELETLKSNIAFGELAAMRAASKTGGALGAISERELSLLESTLGALDPGQSPANFRAQLKKIKDSIERWQTAQGVAGAGKPLKVTNQPAARVGPWTITPVP